MNGAQNPAQATCYPTGVRGWSGNYNILSLSSTELVLENDGILSKFKRKM